MASENVTRFCSQELADTRALAGPKAARLLLEQTQADDGAAGRARLREIRVPRTEAGARKKSGD